jgi:Fe-Mn family superoxide dismutase
MNKRTFLRNFGIMGLAAPFYTLLQSCQSKQKLTVNTIKDQNAPSPTAATSAGPWQAVLPPLGYAFDALQPHIDRLTMEIHHGKHHAAYVNNLNKALADKPHQEKDLLALLSNLSKEDAPALRNNGGGHFNHTLFWQILNPQDRAAQPQGKLLEAIKASFGSTENLVKSLKDAAMGRFGSGWAWLSQGADGKLFVSSTPNQDNPLMKKLVDKPGTPILGIDVWEHAYYLNYQNKRVDYVNAFFEVVNWRVVESLMI